MQLSRNELSDAVTLNGVRYWPDEQGRFHQLVKAGKITTRYTDADSRPGDHSHDGNGWTEKVREYDTAQVTDAALDNQLRDLRDTRYALGDVVPGFMDNMGPAELASFEAARLQAYRTRDGLRLTMDVKKGADGLWVATARPAPVVEENEEELETL